MPPVSCTPPVPLIVPAKLSLRVGDDQILGAERDAAGTVAGEALDLRTGVGHQREIEDRVIDHAARTGERIAGAGGSRQLEGALLDHRVAGVAVADAGKPEEARCRSWSIRRRR